MALFEDCPRGLSAERPLIDHPETAVQSLLLLSGLLCDARIWEPVAERLRDVAAVQILAFPNMDSISAMARLVLNQAGGTFAVAGHSMGGRVALEVLRLSPERVRGIALLNTGVHSRRDSETESRARLVNMARIEGMTALAKEWLPPMMGTPIARQQEVTPTLTDMIEAASAESFAAQTHALLNRPDAQAVLLTIRVPTLFVSGTEDKWSPLAQHRDMQTMVPGSELVAIAAAGHMSPVEQPAQVAESLRTWLQRL